MQVKVKGSVVDSPNDQWCDLLEAKENVVEVRLLKSGDKFIILPYNIIGVRLSESLTIDFNVTRTCQEQSSIVRNL